MVVLTAARAAEAAEQVKGGVDVAQARHIAERRGAVHKDGREKDGQGRVLGAADADGARERNAAPDDELVHRPPAWCAGVPAREDESRSLGDFLKKIQSRGTPPLPEERRAVGRALSAAP